MKLINAIIIAFCCVYLAGCVHGHCQSSANKSKSKISRVWVYKYDQSKQCQKTAGLSLESMALELKEINVSVFESKKEYDGLMRIQACGAFTGLANKYLIKKEDLDKVTNRGFLQWDF
jgi:hypothetical protein